MIPDGDELVVREQRPIGSKESTDIGCVVNRCIEVRVISYRDGLSKDRSLHRKKKTHKYFSPHLSAPSSFKR